MKLKCGGREKNGREEDELEGYRRGGERKGLENLLRNRRSKWPRGHWYSKLGERQGRSEAVSRWAQGDRVGRIDKFQGNPGIRPGPRFLSAGVPATDGKGRTLTGRMLRRCNQGDSNDR